MTIHYLAIITVDINYVKINSQRMTQFSFINRKLYSWGPINLRFIRCELLHGLFRQCNHEKWLHNPLLNFSLHAKVDQIASVSATAQFSTIHYLAKSSRNSSRLINSNCEWTFNVVKLVEMYLNPLRTLHAVFCDSQMAICQATFSINLCLLNLLLYSVFVAIHRRQSHCNDCDIVLMHQAQSKTIFMFYIAVKRRMRRIKIGAS